MPFISHLSSGRQADVVLQLQLGLGVTFSRDKRHAQLVLDGKHGVILQVLAVLVEDLGGQRLVALVLHLHVKLVGEFTKSTRFISYHEMNVSGAEDVSVHQLQQLAGGAINRNLRNVNGRNRNRLFLLYTDGIGCRLQAVEGVVALGICLEDSTQVVVLLLIVLLLVQAFTLLAHHRGGQGLGITLTICRRLPNVNSSILEGLSTLNVRHLAVHVDDLAVRRSVKSNGGSILANGCVCSPEGSQDSGCGQSVGALCRSSE